LLKWRALTRNQTLVFLLSVASLVSTLLFGPFSAAPVIRNIYVRSFGDGSPNIIDNRGTIDIKNQQTPSQPQSKGATGGAK
jgi:hypothetical protein